MSYNTFESFRIYLPGTRNFPHCAVKLNDKCPKQNGIILEILQHVYWNNTGQIKLSARLPRINVHFQRAGPIAETLKFIKLKPYSAHSLLESLSQELKCIKSINCKCPEILHLSITCRSILKQ